VVKTAYTAEAFVDDESGREVRVDANGPMGKVGGKMSLQHTTAAGWRPALFGSDTPMYLADTGGIPTSTGSIPTSPASHIEIPYFNWGDYSGDPVNTQQRWVVYCSAEVFLSRVHTYHYVPGIELALGFYWPDNGAGSSSGAPEIWSRSIRGLGINPTSQNVSSQDDEYENKRCPTSLSYTVVTKFNPNVDTGFGGTRTTDIGGVDYGWERMKIGLYYRWLRGVTPHPEDRNYIGIGNVSLFAVNYRR